MTTTTNQSPAWAFILQHSRQVDSAAWAVVSGTPIEYDDAHTELIAYLVEQHPKFDPERGWGPRTWIRMQAKKVRRSMVRAGVRQDGQTYVDKAIPAPVNIGDVARTEASTAVDLLMRHVTPEQRIACLSVLEGWDAATVRARTGGSTRKRDAVLAAIARS